MGEIAEGMQNLRLLLLHRTRTENLFELILAYFIFIFGVAVVLRSIISIKGFL
jgi:hypothetical protein